MRELIIRWMDKRDPSFIYKMGLSNKSFLDRPFFFFNSSNFIFIYHSKIHTLNILHVCVKRMLKLQNQELNKIQMVRIKAACGSSFGPLH